MYQTFYDIQIIKSTNTPLTCQSARPEGDCGRNTSSRYCCEAPGAQAEAGAGSEGVGESAPGVRQITLTGEPEALPEVLPREGPEVALCGE